MTSLYYQVIKRTGKYQVKLRAIAGNPFLYSDRDPSLPFIKDWFLNDLPPENTLYEFKAWVLEYGLKMVGSFLSWEIWQPYMEEYRK